MGSLGIKLKKQGKRLAKRCLYGVFFWVRNPATKDLYICTIQHFVTSFFTKSTKRECAEFKRVMRENQELREKGRWFYIKHYLCFRVLLHACGLVSEEYFLLGREHTSFRTKSSSVMRWRQNFFQRRVNLKQNRIFLDEKDKFNQMFSEYLHRDWCYSQDSQDIRTFLSRHPEVIIKLLDGSSGRGIYKLDCTALTEEQLADTAKELAGQRVIIEEILRQTGFVHEVNPDTVNTLRVNTLYDNGEVTILATFFRTGRRGALVDNCHAGGIVWTVDSEGCIAFGGQSRGNYYEKHPDSGIVMKGQRIPRFKEAMELCKKVQALIPDVPQCGWDVVISEDYIALIEGNSGAGFWNTTDHGAAWDRMKKYLKEHKVTLDKIHS